MEPLCLEELYRHVAIFLYQLNQNQHWGVKKKESGEVITIHKILHHQGSPENLMRDEVFDCDEANAASHDQSSETIKLEPETFLDQLPVAEVSDTLEIPAKVDSATIVQKKTTITPQRKNTVRRSPRFNEEKTLSTSQNTPDNSVDDSTLQQKEKNPASKRKPDTQALPKQKTRCLRENKFKINECQKPGKPPKAKQKQSCSSNADSDYNPLKPFDPTKLCKKPKKPTPRKSVYHMEKRGNVFHCLKCPLTSPHHSTIIKHCIRAHLDYDHSCMQCPMKFKTKRALKYHVDYVHNDKSGGHICSICGQRFSVKMCLNRHMRYTHRERYASKSVSGNIKCFFCAKKFESIFEKDRHQLSEHAEKIHFCTICSKPFNDESYLIKHIKKMHDGSSLQSCDICSKEFGSDEPLQYHQDAQHEDVDFGVAKPFQCKVECCQMRFRKESFLVDHAKVHLTRQKTEQKKTIIVATKKTEDTENNRSDEESPCVVCGVLLSKAKMKNHMPTHNRKFKCKDCGKEYSRANKMKDHRLAVHANFQLTCPYESCGKTFAKRAVLSIHIKRIHTNRETHRCALCDKTYSHKGDLYQHVQAVHEGKKHYCSTCGKEFLRSSERNRHELRTHGVQKS